LIHVEGTVINGNSISTNVIVDTIGNDLFKAC
jgi:hypothetical protein